MSYGVSINSISLLHDQRAIVYILSTLPEWCAVVSRVTNDAFEIGGVSPLSLGGIYPLW